MLIRAVAGAAGIVGGATTAATNSGGPDLVGIAAVITSIVGAVTLGWTIYQGSKRTARDAQIAADVIEVLEQRKREGRHGEE